MSGLLPSLVLSTRLSRTLTCSLRGRSAGGAFSSTADVAALGKSILTNRLLPPATTRRWLKPTAFANGLTQAAGRPWEIVRVSLPATGEVVDVYTKAGDCASAPSHPLPPC